MIWTVLFCVEIVDMTGIFHIYMPRYNDSHALPDIYRVIERSRYTHASGTKLTTKDKGDQEPRRRTRTSCADSDCSQFCSLYFTPVPAGPCERNQRGVLDPTGSCTKINDSCSARPKILTCFSGVELGCPTTSRYYYGLFPYHP